MTAINLNKGLEALYYFDEQNFDNQRNLLRDHSGYARHAEAIGGPTVGTEGPDDFGATGFDASDDYFERQGPNPQNEQTFFALFNSNDASVRTNIVNALEAHNGYGMFLNNGNVVTQFSDSSNSNTVQTPVSGVNENEWHTGFGVYDGSTIKSIVDDNVNTVSFSNHTPAQVDKVFIGAREGSDTYFDGKIAAYGRWSRALSDAEIAYINRLTAPRRTQL